MAELGRLAADGHIIELRACAVDYRDGPDHPPRGALSGTALEASGLGQCGPGGRHGGIHGVPMSLHGADHHGGFRLSCGQQYPACHRLRLDDGDWPDRCLRAGLCGDSRRDIVVGQEARSPPPERGPAADPALLAIYRKPRHGGGGHFPDNSRGCRCRAFPPGSRQPFYRLLPRGYRDLSRAFGNRLQAGWYHAPGYRHPQAGGFRCPGPGGDG